MWGHWGRRAKLSLCWSIAQRGQLEEDKQGGVHLTPREGSIWAAPRALGWGCEPTRAGSAVGPGWAPSRWSRGSITGRQLAAHLLLGRQSVPVLLSLQVTGTGLWGLHRWHLPGLPCASCPWEVAERFQPQSGGTASGSHCLAACTGCCCCATGEGAGAGDAEPGCPQLGLVLGRTGCRQSHHVGVVWVLLAPDAPLRPHLRAPLLWFKQPGWVWDLGISCSWRCGCSTWGRMVLAGAGPGAISWPKLLSF